jgi:hypothetical protein
MRSMHRHGNTVQQKGQGLATGKQLRKRPFAKFRAFDTMTGRRAPPAATAAAAATAVANGGTVGFQNTIIDSQ